MRRDLIAGQQCEHITPRYINGAYVKEPCTVRHLHRVDGKPQQLVPVKDNRMVRFMCLKHAPQYQRDSTKYRHRKKKEPPPEQERLL